MSPDAGHLKARLLDWLRAAVDEGWLAPAEVASLEALEDQDANRLFDTGDARPLTIGLFGGTGVGKSSLLNRIVGEPVAAVGLERPTSVEVTVYVHEQFPVVHLAELLPVERVRVLEHRRDAYRYVVWIDMPDIDSIEHANRELVFEWLPYVDWLIYVVSPEKYRDDVGWQVLSERGFRHHWLFVMNHWDTGSEAQLADLKRILEEAGFDHSRVLTTSCTSPAGDDFDRIMETIDRAVSDHGLEQLQRVGERARLQELRKRCDRYAALLGAPDQWQAFIRRAAALLDDKLGELNRYLADEAAIEAASLPDRRSGDAPGNGFEPSLPGLVGEYVQDLQATVTVSLEGLPAGPVEARTRGVLESLDERLAGSVREAFQDGRVRPGGVIQRSAATVLQKLVYGLPLAAGIGVGYIVVTRYQEGLNGTGDFLGLDFLAHSVLILGLAALVPYLLHKLVRPSVRRSIVKRVNERLRRVRDEVGEEWAAGMRDLADRVNALHRSLGAVRAAVANPRYRVRPVPPVPRRRR